MNGLNKYTKFKFETEISELNSYKLICVQLVQVFLIHNNANLSGRLTEMILVKCLVVEYKFS